MTNNSYNACTNILQGKTIKYFGTDSGKPKNLFYQGPDFNYTFNSFGFRGPELELNKDCLVSFGPSLAVGIGVPEEKRFTELLASHYQLKHFSFACHGGDNLSIFNNITKFFDNNFENLNVKKLIVLWADTSRYSTFTETKNSFERKIFGAGFEKNMSKEQLDFLLFWEKNCSQLYTLDFAKNVDLLCKIKNIECIQISVNHIELSKKYNIDSFYSKNEWYSRNIISWKDYGRDFHPGIKSHEGIYQKIIEILGK